MPIATASQTIGPYWHLIEEADWADLTRFGATGDKIILTGTITDGAGALVTDAAIEIWQSDPPASDTFTGYGRSRTDATGTFRLTTIKPGPVAGLGNAQQAPPASISPANRSTKPTPCWASSTTPPSARP
jgi:protocatechuate 3,4-dioxygenase alpha subunit